MTVGCNIPSNKQDQMLVQNLNRIVNKPNVTPWQILYRTTDCIKINLVFQKNLPTNTQVWNSLCLRNYRRQRGMIWVTYGCYNGNPYWVRSIGHQAVKFHYVHGSGRQSINWSQQDTVEKSKAATPWRFLDVKPNHSWWHPFKSVTNRNYVCTSSAFTAAIDVTKQLTIRSTISGLQ